MEPDNRCTECGTPLPADAPHGLCPACVLGQALIAEAPAGTADQDALPTVAELAVLFPDLEILELIGRGGMGAVYKARQKSLDRLVALKILSPAIGRDPEFSERFFREAKLLARLSHPRIVAVYDSGQVQGLFHFLMEYVDGVNLRQLIAQARPAPAQVLAMIAQICEGLQYAHNAGVVHRDIKPENILLDKNLDVKIADFGLGMLTGSHPADLTLTEPGAVMGTAYYMAPEQLERPDNVDHRADIYSLGVVFYQLLTGELPVGRFALPSQKVQVGGRIDEVVLKALEKDPQQRYQQADNVRTDVQSLAGDQATACAGQGLVAGAGPCADLFRAKPATLSPASKTLLIVGMVALLLIGVGLLVLAIVVFRGMLSPTPLPPPAVSVRSPRTSTTTHPVRTGFTSVYGPLIKAVVDYDLQGVQDAIAAGADVNAPTTMGDRQPPMLYAVFLLPDSRAVEMVKLLVDKGASVNCRRDRFEYTPLILASGKRMHKTAAFLLSHGADVSLVDSRGRTALSFATEKGDTEMIALLQSAAGISTATSRPARPGASGTTAVSGSTPEAPPLNLSGRWSLTNPKRTYTVSFRQVEPGHYKLLPDNLAYSGVYEQSGDRLIMIQAASPAYTDLVWKIHGPDHLELITTSYRGSTLARQSP